MTTKISIKGMHCKSCEMLVKDVLEELDVKPISFDVNFEEKIGRLEVNESENINKIKSEITKETGYETE